MTTSVDARATTLSSDGTDVWYEDRGGTGEPLLFIHGLSGSSSASGHFARRVEDAGLRFLRMDMRGHGMSGKPAGTPAYALARFNDDAFAVMDACGVERAHVVGHCFGGVVAIRMGLDHPERVASLTLVGTSVQPSGDKRVPAWVERLVRRHGRAVVSRAFPRDCRCARHVDYGRFRAMGDWYVPRMVADYRVLSGEVAFDILGTLDDIDLLDAARMLGPRTLVVHGARDTVFPLEAAERLSAAVPGARLLVLPDDNHVTPVLDPRSALFGAIVEFVSGARVAAQ